MWTIVFLAMGGIALGKGVASSGLLGVVGDGIRDLMGGLSLPAVVLLLTFVVLVRVLGTYDVMLVGAHFRGRLFRPSSVTRSRAYYLSRLRKKSRVIFPGIINDS